MAECYTFTVPGKPVPKARPRVTRYGTYTHPRTQAYQELVAFHARRACRVQFAGPVRCDLLIVLKRPKALCRRKDPEGLLWAPVSPDQDNVAKAVMDAINGIAWADDSQVWAGETVKVYGGKGEEPRVIVRVCALDAAQPSLVVPACFGLDGPKGAE